MDRDIGLYRGAAGWGPDLVYILVGGKGTLLCIYIDMVEVQYDVSRVGVKLVVVPRRKLPAETNNGELLLLVLVTSSYLANLGTRPSSLDPM